MSTIDKINSYSVTSEGVTAEIHIEKDASGLNYRITLPEISNPTNILLLELKKRLITEVTIGASEILDMKAIQQVKEKFTSSAGKLLDLLMPGLTKETKSFLIGRLI